MRFFQHPCGRSANLFLRNGARQSVDLETATFAKGADMPPVLERGGYLRGTLLLAHFLCLLESFVRFLFL
jgi:hypothetical protein